jgi:hypothetical protein
MAVRAIGARPPNKPACGMMESATTDSMAVMRSSCRVASDTVTPGWTASFCM